MSHDRIKYASITKDSGITAAQREIVQNTILYLDCSHSHNTKLTYRKAWQSFVAWCTKNGVQSMPANQETIALFLSDNASRYKVASLHCFIAAIKYQHKVNGREISSKGDLIQRAMRGIRNKRGSLQKSKDPLLTHDLRNVLNHLPDTLQGIRDRALLLLGFAGAFRRSELVALNVEDICFASEGLRVLLRKSKTDQQGEGREVAIPYGTRPSTCPVNTLKRWLEEARIESGALFRSINRHGHISEKQLSDKAVALIVKKGVEAYAIAQGLSEQEIAAHVGRFSGHSLRAGLATSAAKAGVAEHIIMKQTGHKKSDTLKKYIRLGTQFDENAAAQVGL